MLWEKFCNLVSVDQNFDVVLCIVCQEGLWIIIYVVGCFYYNEFDNSCEVVFVICEMQQGKGMGSCLLIKFIDIVCKWKINKMLVFCWVDNKLMIVIFEYYGFKCLFSGDFSEVELELLLQEFEVMEGVGEEIKNDY